VNVRFVFIESFLNWFIAGIIIRADPSRKAVERRLNEMMRKGVIETVTSAHFLGDMALDQFVQGSQNIVPIVRL
jgi:hypothetical protein